MSILPLARPGTPACGPAPLNRKGPVDMEWYQWILILLLIGLIAAFVVIRKKQNR